MFWKTRWETASTAAARRTGRSSATRKRTPTPRSIRRPEWTGTWRDPRFSPPADGGRPENALTGTIFTVNRRHLVGIRFPAMRAACASGATRDRRRSRPEQIATLPDGTLGYEWDEDLDNGFRPAGLITPVATHARPVPAAPARLRLHLRHRHRDAQPDAVPRRAERRARVRRRHGASGRWGLDDGHDRPAPRRPTCACSRRPSTSSPTWARSRARCSPAWPRRPLPTTPRRRRRRSVARIGAAVVPRAAPVMITGTARDTGGAVAGGRGVHRRRQTWHRATGTTNWTYRGRRSVRHRVTMRSRAYDDNGNMEVPSPAFR